MERFPLFQRTIWLCAFLFPALGAGPAWAVEGDCLHRILSSLQELDQIDRLTQRNFKDQPVESLKAKIREAEKLLDQGGPPADSIPAETQWQVIDLYFHPDPTVSRYAEMVMARFKEVYPAGRLPGSPGKAPYRAYSSGHLGFGKLYKIYNTTTHPATRVWALHQMGHVDVPEAVGFDLCLIFNEKAPASLRKEAFHSLRELAGRDSKWYFDEAFIPTQKPILEMLLKGIQEPSWGVRDACFHLIQKLGFEKDEFPPELIAGLGSPDQNLDAYVRKRMLEKPDRNLPSMFSKASVPFKLGALDILEHYGATTLFSYPTMLMAACDPDPGVQAKALQALARKGILHPPCPSVPEGPGPAQETAEPFMRFDGVRQALDNVSTGLGVAHLKAGTRKVLLELDYPAGEISKITVTSYGNPVFQDSSGHLYCEIPLADEKSLTGFQNVGFDITLEPRDHPVPGPSAWSKLPSKPVQEAPLTLTARLTGTLGDGTSYEFPPKEEAFRFISQAWRQLGRKPYGALTQENHESFKDTRPEYDHEPGVEEIQMDPRESFLVISMNTYGGGGQGGGYVQVFKKSGNTCERILNKEGSYELNHTTVDWGPGKALVVADDYCSQGDGKGSLYFYQGGGLKKVFEFDASDNAFQATGSFDARLESQDGKLYLVRQEQLPQWQWQDHLLMEARPQKAELTWNWLKQKFIQGPFQPVNP